MSDFKAKMHKIQFRLGPDPAGRAYSAPPDPLAGFKVPTSKGGEEGRGREGSRDGAPRPKSVQGPPADL